MLVAARLRHITATDRGAHVYMNMHLLEEMDKEAISSSLMSS